MSSKMRVDVKVCVYHPITRQVLLVDRRVRGWALPGGFLEQSDLSIVACAQRRVLKETGVNLDGLTAFIDSGDVVTRLEKTHLLVNVVVVYEVPGGYAVGYPLPPVEEKGHTVRWVPLEQVRGLLRDREPEALLTVNRLRGQPL